MPKAKDSATAAIILAAGKGTRMRSALPKVMHPIAGFPMVAHAAHQAQKAGCSPLCIVTAPGMGAVLNAVQAIEPNTLAATQTEQHGTAHAVLSARDALKAFGGNLLVLYGDTPLVRAETMQRLIAALDDPKCAVAVLGFTPPDAGDYGRLVVHGGTLERIVEAREATDDEKKIALCNSGVMALRGSVAWGLLAEIGNANRKGEYYLTDIVALALAAGHTAVAVEGDAEEVLGVNSRNELARAETIFQERARQTHMANGVTLLDPASVYFSADSAVEADTLIEPNVFFGPGVSIGGNCHIKAFSHIEGATIGKDCVIGPFARLRPGTVLAPDVKIGNFVELKKAAIDTGAKISHLSYIGDAKVGADANLGAGTITCNYDGHHKYGTVIGRGVFIGSHSALVAPVTIGDGAMVAAGSTITENIPADALGIARTRQETKRGWAKIFRARQADTKIS